MLLLNILPLIAIGIIVGVLIGCVGIGGVLLVPALKYIGGVDIHTAIASCMLSYLFSGVVGAVTYAKRGSIRWSMCIWLCLGAMPGAFAGAKFVSVVPAISLELIIASLILFAGFRALSDSGDRTATETSLGRSSVVLIGAITGFGSAMSGTGGPLLLVPILVWFNLPVLTAVGLSQVIQVPVAVMASVGNYLYGTIDFRLAIGIAVLLMIGVMAGARVAHHVSQDILRRIVAIALVSVGVLILIRLIIPLIAL